MGMEFNHVVTSIASQNRVKGTQLLRALGEIKSSLTTIKNLVADSIQESVSASNYEDISDKLGYCRELDSAISEIDQLAHRLSLTKESTTGRSEGTEGASQYSGIDYKERKTSDIGEARKVRKTEAKKPSKTSVPADTYKVIPFSRDPKAMYNQKLKRYFISLPTNRGRKKGVQVHLDEDRKILYYYDSELKACKDVFSKDLVALHDFDGVLTKTIRINAFAY